MEFSEQEVEFTDIDLVVRFSFTPTDYEEWITHESYDVNFDYELGSINVYDSTNWSNGYSVNKSIHNQKITY